MNDYLPTIGLEIHAELKTQTKMFCNSKNDPYETRPNVNICPVCMAHPGTLPTINKEAVRHVVRVGVSLGGRIADYTEFDRKNYFYPDIPKGYQISQYKHPLVSGGELAGVAITRVHLEEDTARSLHDLPEVSRIDFNRAGVPLMELVTEPVIHSPEEAATFARELQLLLRALGASDANMEQGQMRVEANISVQKIDGSTQLGTKVEVKNLNSFRSVERAIRFEIERQTGLLERGERVVQETRGWDEGKQQTFSQRMKESSHDYRYFPDPDLPKLYLSEIPEFEESAVRQNLPELPSARRARYLSLGLKKEDADMFVREDAFGAFFDAVCAATRDPLLSANYIASDIAGRVAEGALELEVLAKKETAVSFADLMNMLSARKISSRAAKDILPRVLAGEDPQTIAESEGLFQKSDRASLEELVRHVIEANPKPVADYRAGKGAALQSLLGQGMRMSKGSADPQLLQELLKEKILKGDE